MQRSSGSFSRPSRLRPLAAIVPLIAGFSCAHAASPLPSGGQFATGSGSITGGGRSLVIDQTSPRGVIDWKSFSIGSGRQVTFNNGNGATLNRVTGGDSSTILGQLTATGSVYLINPQGVLIGPGGVVATGGRFVASSLNISDAAFMKGGDLTFSGDGRGVVVNLGKIGSSGGDVFLVSRTSVVNAGSIDAPKGSAELATGAQVLLHDASSGQQVFVLTGSQGTATNAGAIRAAQVSLQAADGNVYALAGNNAAIRATGTATRDGHVWLVAGQGAVHAAGSIVAANANGSGGTVETRAATLDVANANVGAGQWTLSAPTFTIDSATADALSRSLGNGTWVNAQSGGDLAVNGNVRWNGNASLTLGAAHSVTVAQTSTIANSGGGNLTLRADANGADNGGSVTNRGKIDWSGSTGIVSALYDMNGSYAPGTLLTHAGWTAAPYSGLVTQITAYKLVNTLADLGRVSQNLAGNYALGKDIDASATANGNGFTPIGATPATPFTGQFDGFGHGIDSLAVGDPSSSGYVGMFGVIGASGVVRDINLTNANVGGAAPSTYGLLAAQNNGLIAYASTSGDLSYGGFGGGGNGGLVGVNNGQIVRSSSSAFVSYQGASGGLVGVNAGTIAQSYATGNVTAGSHGSVGGLVAFNTGTITQSYATGSTGGQTGDGGLVYDNGSTGVINESFAVGQVGGGGAQFPGYGGIAAFNEGKINNNVYWNRDTTTLANAVGTENGGTAPGNGNGLSNTQMGQKGSFASWNFGAGGAWTMPVNGTHPVLSWEQARP
ncbi:filamentous hemagglutinin N-terminal domain-containing protein [Caballeronia sp. LZ062]|uniref:two-partner secretion domain-containing protein n=1 Tax=unclassified Caballeronia TaxID=2646786 RepID=UPI00286064ED|nr:MULTISPECIES: filamentous hemagglutinin N-terminal domain-containing protein [unclassified Caballeronia]MDR5856383.1 filamentous hemagglutinin N-terminal domain-containing protein [Caballeronia sp. LZ050]MDR5873053.1 filamentous hemagglutinin N-terminal domain-containing protein [Caballeronia sp. LZ062]